MKPPIQIGDTIHHNAVPPGLLDITVQGIKPCEGEGDGQPGDHPSYRINDPETGEPDWVCSRDFSRAHGS